MLVTTLLVIFVGNLKTEIACRIHSYLARRLKGYILQTANKQDALRLSANLSHGINTVLISPRRWGKTSLVKKVIEDVSSDEIKVVFIDIFHCKSAYDFLRTFATAVIKQTSSRMDEWISYAKGFLSNISPKFSFGTDPMNDFSLSFEWNESADTEEAILALPERICEKKHIRMVICLDEFQQIAEFPDSLTFQKKLRSVWQHQQAVNYCMFGSKRHLMEKIFNDKSMPFYKFGDMMFLQKIPASEWIPFICGKFEETGKHIREEQAERICIYTENLSSYVQHLSWIVWYISGAEVTDQNIEDALDDLLEQNKVFFQREVEQLTEYQFNFLRAMADGITTGLGRQEVLKEYRLESTSHIQSIKKALIKKGLIYEEGDSLVFDDPLFKRWILRHVH